VSKYLSIFAVVYLLSLTSNDFAQGIVINEIMSSNSSYYFDEFGETPDWIELYNGSGENIDLSSYFLSDNKNLPNKWAFPAIDLPADSILLVNASGRDIKANTASWETVIDKGDSWSYLLGTTEPSSNWKDIEFLSIGWNLGFSGIGYGDDDDLTVITPQKSIYLRKEFEISDLENISAVLFNIDYDDGFVAYLNGQEIARANLGNSGEFVPFNQYTDEAREALLYRNLPLETFFIKDISSIIVSGVNVLSIQVHNFGENSSDLTAIPFLTIGYKSGGTKYIADQVRSFLPKIHTNFSISNGNESVYLFDSSGNIVDSVSAILLPNNTSYGRNLNDINSWSIFQNPTPGYPNSELGYAGQTDIPIISLPSGFYQTNVNLTISNQAEGIETYYTLDGSEPNSSSPIFNDQLLINKTSVLKLKSFKMGFLPSETVTDTYFINENSNLPIISLSTDPINLWDYYEGIYVLGPDAESAFPYFNANFWQDWRKEATFQLFDENKIYKVSSQDVEIKIFGGWSRGNDQKSLSIFGLNGEKTNYKLFKELDVKDFSSVVLRNSGNDWGSTMLRDGFMQTLANDLNIDNLAYEPAILFLNGEYWGIHNIREKINLNYISSHYSAAKQDIDLLELDGNIIDGTNESYLELKQFITNNNLASEANYEFVKQKLDIDSFIDYQLFQIYIANTDWPGNNSKFWRDRSINGKWRWILFDTDFGFGWDYGEDYNHNTLSFALQSNGPGWPNPPWATLFLRKLIANDSFRNNFINRYSDLSNSYITASKVKELLEKSSDEIRSEIPNHAKKWGQFSSSQWELNINKMKRFADLRIVYLNEYFKNQFSLSGIGKVEITLSEPNSGKVKINSIIPQTYPWKGDYFIGQEIKLIAQPNPGFIFNGWSGAVSSSQDTLLVDISAVQNIVANFQINSNHPQIVINEINYNSSSSFDTEDWIELFNNSDEIIDVSNWVLKDEVDTNIFVIKEGTVISPLDYLVLSRDTLSFRNYLSESVNLSGNFEFGLNNSGDLIRLFDNDGLLIDSLRYDDLSPWPIEADGSGSTLELINPELDNSINLNWKSSVGFGTPGGINSTFVTEIKEQNVLMPQTYSLSQNYPNPFNPTTIIKYSIPNSENGRGNLVNLKIFDLLGREIKVLVKGMQSPGNYEIGFNAADLTSGIYFYQLTAGDFKETKKMILLK
jgi:hypothetical protein